MVRGGSNGCASSSFSASDGSGWVVRVCAALGRKPHCEGAGTHPSDACARRYGDHHVFTTSR
eukprot:5317870-Pyramimonas_sp.AAC.1